MRLAFNSFVAARGVIPLYPPCKWKTGSTGSSDGAGDADEDGFRSVKLELRSVPGDATSPKYSEKFYVFESGTPEQWCRWNDDLVKVWTCLSLTSGPDRRAMTLTLLAGSAKDTFEEYFARPSVTATVDHVSRALRYVAARFFPDYAAQNQTSYLRYEGRKPARMSARGLATRLRQVNKWFDYFPNDGGNRTDVVDRLNETELPLIYERMLPAAWLSVKELMFHDYRQNRFNFEKQIDYAEQLEVYEMRHGVTGLLAFGSSKANKGRKPGEAGVASGTNAGPELGTLNRGRKTNRDSPSKKGNNGKNSKNCRLHGEGCGHSDSECKVWLNHASKVAAVRKAQHPSTLKKSPHKGRTTHNKTWRRGESNGANSGERTYTSKEVLAMVKAARASVEKKAREDSDVEMELNNIEEDEDGIFEELSPEDEAQLEAFINENSNE